MRFGPLLIVALAVILVGDVMLLLYVQRAEERARRAEGRAQEAERRAAAPRGVFLTESEIQLLKRAGLTDPMSQLRSDLEAHSSLLPFKGTMGGTMKFYDRDGIILLPGRYVYAPAEDGHYMVHAILKYDVEAGGKIRWRLVDASRD